MGIDYLAQSKKNESLLFALNLIYQFFIETFVGMIIGYFLGRFLDNLFFENKDILMYILILLGMLSGLVNLIKRVIKNIAGGNENEEKDEHH